MDGFPGKERGFPFTYRVLVAPWLHICWEYVYIYIWRFPRMGVPLHHPF